MTAECYIIADMLRFTDYSLLISRILTLLIAFTCHEFSHAFTAVRLGDDTPRRDGRLSLNPLRHLDPVGCLMLIVVGFGWAKPVRVDARAVTRKNKAGMMLVAAAGPFANLVLAVIGAVLFRSRIIPNQRFFGLSWMPTPYYFLAQFIRINLSLMVFNLIPLRPLDGEKVLGYFIPGSFRKTWQMIQSYGQQILIMCFFVLPYLKIDFARDFISSISAFLYGFLTGGY